MWWPADLPRGIAIPAGPLLLFLGVHRFENGRLDFGVELLVRLEGFLGGVAPLRELLAVEAEPRAPLEEDAMLESEIEQ